MTVLSHIQGTELSMSSIINMIEIFKCTDRYRFVQELVLVMVLIPLQLLWMSEALWQVCNNHRLERCNFEVTVLATG